MHRDTAYHRLHTLFTRVSQALRVRALKLLCYRIIGDIPWVGRIYRSRFLISRGRIHNRRLDLCIEGFPRSANSFFTHWFLLLNPDAQVAHHSHDIECVRLALDDRIPTIILIRNPLDAATSWAVMTDSKEPVSCLESWIIFYRWILKQPPSKYVLIAFSEATRPTSKTIAKINSACGTHFLSSDKEDDVLYKMTRERIKNHAKQNWEAGDHARNIPMPNKERDQIKHRYREKIKNAPALKEAEDLYNSLILGSEDA